MELKNLNRINRVLLLEATRDMCTVMSGRRPFGKGDFCFDDLRCLARGAVMSSAYDATSMVGRWP